MTRTQFAAMAALLATMLVGTAGAQEKTSPASNPELTSAPIRKAAERRNETEKNGTHFAA